MAVACANLLRMTGSGIGRHVGMWTATISLKPERSQYMFVIDGKQWIADPLAGEASGDGFGAENEVRDVSI